MERRTFQGSSVHFWPLSKYAHTYSRDRERDRERERERRVRNPFFEGSEACLRRHCDVLAGEGTGSRFPVGVSRTRNCRAATQIGPAPNNRAYYRPFVSGSRVTFFPPSPPLFFYTPFSSSVYPGVTNRHLPSATRVQGVVFRFKRPRYIVADSKEHPTCRGPVPGWN